MDVLRRLSRAGEENQTPRVKTRRAPIRSLALGFGLTFAVSAACAQSWKREPETILGATFGVKPDWAQIEQCGSGQHLATKYGFCSMAISGWGSLVPLGGFPVNEFRSGMMELDADENLVQLTIYAKHADYQVVRSILIERYGQPTKRDVVTLKNKLGATFSSERLSWSGSRIIAMLSEWESNLNDSSVTFAYTPWLSKLVREDTERVKAGASKL